MASKSLGRLSKNADVSSANADGQQANSARAFGARLQARAGELKVSRSDLRTWTGTPNQTFGGYWNGERLPPPELLLDLAERLSVNPRWLLTGQEPPRGSMPISADEADWVTIEEFDLRELTDEGKGDARAPSPFRRDWLNQTLGMSSGLWLTRLLSDYPAAALAEGTLVFCIDVEAAELLEGQLCLFRINGGLIVGRFSFRARGAVGAAGDRLGEVVITSSEIGTEENHYVPVARILGRLIGRV